MLLFLVTLEEIRAMPASYYSAECSDTNSLGYIPEDMHAYQLAIDIQRLGMDDSTPLDLDLAKKKSQNTTECVRVPSSEHVAEIVGRQGVFLLSFSVLY